MFAATDDAFFDIHVGDRSIHWSPAITLIVGPDTADADDRLSGWLSLVHPRDRRAIARCRRSLVRDGSCSVEFGLRRADGTYAPVRVRAFAIPPQDGIPAHVVGALTDLAPVRQLEREVREAAERLEFEMARTEQDRVRGGGELAHSPPMDVIWDWTLERDELAWGANVEAVLGYPASALATVADFIERAPDLAIDEVETRQRIVAGTATAWSRRYSWTLPSGERIRVESHAYVLTDGEGRARHVIGSVHRVPAEGEPRRDVALTERQRRVFDLVRLGRTNKEIAHDLGVSEQAAKTQVSKLLRKFGAGNRAALAAAALTEPSSS